MHLKEKFTEKTGSNGETFIVENPDYEKRNPMTHLRPKKKKRKK